MTDSDFAKRIQQAKDLLPLEQLIDEIGDSDRVAARLCPFHSDSTPSFSVFTFDGQQFWRCHAGCGAGDQISYLEATYNCSRGDAIRKLFEMAGVDYEDDFGGGTFR
jgi:DNA primase